MKVTVLGCRGSYPVTYPEIMRYGGDTTCLSVLSDTQMVVLDAGTGIRKLDSLPSTVREIHMFITHLHWDHIIGFPQWPLLHTRPDLSIHLYSLERSHDRFYAALERSISKPLYPRSLEDIVTELKVHEIKPGDIIEIAQELQVTCAMANHPYRALAYRLENAVNAVAFVPDTSPFDRYLFDDDIVLKETSLTPSERDILSKRQDKIIELAGDADWLIYDLALTPQEYEILPHWGHSTPHQAVDMARQAGAGSLLLFHHNPNRTDDMVDRLLEEQQRTNPDMTIAAAYAGMGNRPTAKGTTVTMRIEFWGVRGSAATPDADKIRYGGNTCTVIVTCPNMSNHFFVLDAGTGLARFGGTLNLSENYEATLLLSHLHLFHIIGFQFTPFAYSPRCNTRVIGPSTRNIAMETLFDHIMAPSYSPVYGLENLMADVAFEEIDTEIRRVGSVRIQAVPFEHSEDTDSWAYRLDDGTNSLVYLTDALVVDGDGVLKPKAVDLVAGANILIVGAFNPAHEHAHRTSYGNALALARAGKVGQLILSHHHPQTNDEALDDIQEQLTAENPDIEISIAWEGLVIDL